MQILDVLRLSERRRLAESAAERPLHHHVVVLVSFWVKQNPKNHSFQNCGVSPRLRLASCSFDAWRLSAVLLSRRWWKPALCSAWRKFCFLRQPRPVAIATDVDDVSVPLWMQTAPLVDQLHQHLRPLRSLFLALRLFQQPVCLALPLPQLGPPHRYSRISRLLGQRLTDRLELLIYILAASTGGECGCSSGGSSLVLAAAVSVSCCFERLVPK